MVNITVYPQSTAFPYRSSKGDRKRRARARKLKWAFDHGASEEHMALLRGEGFRYRKRQCKKRLKELDDALWAKVKAEGERLKRRNPKED